jgi:hypothetical protein
MLLAPHCCRKFLLKSLWSCALVWYCQKHHLTTCTSVPQHLTNKQLFSSHLTDSEKLPLHQRQFVRSNCRTLDQWVLGGPVAGATPLLLCSCSKPVQISGLGTGTRFSYAHSSHTAYRGTIIHTVGTRGIAVQCQIISAVLWLDYLQTILYVSIHQHFTFIT